MNLFWGMLERQRKKGDSKMEWLKKEKMPFDITKGSFLEVFFFAVWHFLKKQKYLKEGLISWEFIKSLGARSSIRETLVKYIPTDIGPLKTQETI